MEMSVCLLLLLSLSLTACYDLHLSDTLHSGAVLLDLSLGPGWIYTLEKTLVSKPLGNVLKVERMDGAVSLVREVNCTRLAQSNPVPLKFRISSLTTQDSVVVYFNVFVHGQNCFIKYRRKSASNEPDVHIDYLYSLGKTSCFSSGVQLVNLENYVPDFSRRHVKELSDRSCVSEGLDLMVRNGSVFARDATCLSETTQGTVTCALHGSREESLSVRVKLRLETRPTPVEHRAQIWKLRRKRGVNSAPAFQLPNYQVSVPENEPTGTHVITLKAADTDSGEAGRIEYSMEALFDSRSNDFFRIDSQTGSIETQRALDREFKDTHVFKVTATDFGTPRRSATSYLTVTVRDTNDHGPVFEQTEYRVSIRENVEVGFEVMTVRATDEDAPSNANMIYKIVNSDGVNSVFEIDSRNGLVRVRVRPDRETLAQYMLIVEANDQGKDPGPLSATATVHITVEDENDNFPQFSEKRYVVQVPENVPVNTRVAQVEATDKDEGNNAKVHYSIIKGNVKGQFYIHSLTGVIDVINPLDYETHRDYSLGIKAQDGGRPPLINSTGLVIVQVIDINDNAPMFVSTPFQATILENVPIGYSVIHIQAIDSDSGENARLDYRLTDTASGFPFTINNSTGWITASAPLDRETTEYYTFGVEARDNGIPVMSSSASVSITVLDVNDNAPTFTEKIYSLKINEDAVVGSSVLTVTAVDRDINSVVTYQISSGNTRNRFAITSQSGGGLITLALPLDYKQERQYVLTITASDGTLYDTAQVFINVTDANTHRPVFQSANYQVLFSEDKPVGSTVVVISATDEDTGENARITYIMEDKVPQFAIDPDTGAITTQMEIDYEDQASYTLAIIAHDNGIPQKSDTTYVEIIVEDANDNVPQFSREKYQGTVFEDAPQYTSVLQISASDRDSGSNGRVSYTFQGGDDGEGDFFIEQFSGIIRTNRKLDRENIPVYNLKAYAVDRGIPPLKAPVEIQVSVLDINDNAPVFEQDELYIEIQENSPIDSVVARITAKDPDEGTNAQIMYQIVEGNIPEVFDLDIFTGDLKALTDLDYETKTEYVIVVQATSAPLVSRATVHIRLVDVNDNQPVLQNFEIIFNNYITNKSNSFPTGVIGNVPAHDPDVSDKLKYSFEEGNELSLLILNPDTGELKLSRDLDNNRALEATMKVSVTDGLHRVTALCTLRVTIITDDMLTNSITVRLENMSQERFLSPLLGLFTEGVATVLSTSRDGVFIFNVQNDSDVSGSILNVTFSALLPGGTPGRYFPSEELQEQIYLNRTLLRHISSQRVLPFDDNICLREPCENYMKCVSVLKFDSSPPFIASDTMLFRPIHPINGLRCRCPAGFTGDYCETEIDLCYSGPCRNNGRCRSREGGYTCECPEDFTGEHCEVNARSGRCVPGVCKNGGKCVDLLVGGFICQCPSGEYEKPYCEMTTRSFPGQSFITFRGLRQRFHFTVSFMFATQERNALLLYNGRFNEKHDFIAVEIIEEQIQLTFSAGGETKTTVAPFVSGGVSDGQWHSVQLHYYNKDSLHLLDASGVLRVPLYTAWLELTHKEPNIGRLGVPNGPSGEKVAVVAVDECDIAMAVRFGAQIGNYSCAAQGTQTGQKKSLDLTGPLLLGGVPNLPEDFPVRNRDFVGCMRNLTIDSKPMDMANFIANNGTAAGCPAKRNFCKEGMCQYGAQCENKWNTYSCDCPNGRGGKNCEQVMPSPQFFDGHAMVSWSDHDITVAVPWYIGLMFRTRQSSTTATLMQANAGPASQINLQVVNRQVQMEVMLREQRVALLNFPEVRVNDGEWHHLLVEITSSKEGKDTKYMAQVSLDYDMFKRSVEIGNELPGLKIKSLYVGGVQGENNNVLKGFQGCIQGVRMGETSTNTGNINMQQGLKIRVEEGCDLADPCESNICPDNSYCMDEWSAHSCVCDPGFFGKDCIHACTLNPCEHVSTCTQKPSSSHGYTCECDQNYYGQYCENNKEVRKNLKLVFTGKKLIPDESTTTRASLLTRSLNCNNTYTEDGTMFRSAIGESTVSLESTIRSGKSHSGYHAYAFRDDQKPSISSGTAKAGHADIDGSLFHRNGTKADDSDSDSELSVDEHSSSYASSHSSDSEDDDEEVHMKPKWNNERQPLHSTPKGDPVSNHIKPYWPVEATTASDSEEAGGAEKLRVETKVNVELHTENKLNHIGEPPQDKDSSSKDGGTTNQTNSNHQPEQRKGILKNKITYPPPLTDKNMKNKLREKLSDYNPPTISSHTPCVTSNDGINSHNVLIKPPHRGLASREQQNGMVLNINGGNQSDSELMNVKADVDVKKKNYENEYVKMLNVQFYSPIFILMAIKVHSDGQSVSEGRGFGPPFGRGVRVDGQVYKDVYTPATDIRVNETSLRFQSWNPDSFGIKSVVCLFAGCPWHDSPSRCNVSRMKRLPVVVGVHHVKVKPKLAVLNMLKRLDKIRFRGSKRDEFLDLAESPTASDNECIEEILMKPRLSLRDSEDLREPVGSGALNMATMQDLRSDSERLNEVKGHLEIALLEKHFLQEELRKLREESSVEALKQELERERCRRLEMEQKMNDVLKARLEDSPPQITRKQQSPSANSTDKQQKETVCSRLQRCLYDWFGVYIEDFRFQPEENTVEPEEPLSAKRLTENMRRLSWRIQWSIVPEVSEPVEPPKEDLTVSEKFQLVLDVAQKAQNLFGKMADVLEKIKNLFMWVQPEITQKLYIALWVAFISSCILPYKLMGFSMGLYAGIKFFIIDFLFKSCPKLRDKYDTPYIVWNNLPTDPQLKERNNATISRRIPPVVSRSSLATIPSGMSREDDSGRSHNTKRGAFHEIFNLPETERPLFVCENGWRCCLINRDRKMPTDYIRNGLLYVTENYLCFESSSSRSGSSKKNKVIKLVDITDIQKYKVLSVLPGSGMGISIATPSTQKPLVFGAMIHRDEAFEAIFTQYMKIVTTGCQET
ncbi:Cadherin EGF LAG seven-pass G-type receptor 1 [Bagarius yarrelli]|uniref:Cadherin EGF LAG seven-pass G-type receptor 1 n=1 Tax=Bagarius yarrelli TaxID=175774 RepID=A0A556TH52_BAGYA|nr:Cadherin EGF LAG seven-pass G-type receptor 1 [Bagarius yarrelli]